MKAYKQNFMRGNVESNVQLSSYIRSANELECNGHINQPRDLQNFDIKPFISNGYSHVAAQKAREFADKYDGCILYAIRHFNGPKNKVIVGYVITTKDFKHLWSTTRTNRADHYAVLYKAINQLTKPRG